MPCARRLASLLALFAVLLPTTPAHGWTRTSVRGTGAHLDIGDDGVTRVVLKVTVHVGGGWISRFDIEGLDPELVLDPDKPVWIDALSPTDEQKYLPQAELKKDGRLRVSFPNRRVAPWRGDYELGVLYTTRRPVEQAEQLPDGTLRVRWALPTWPASLENVRLEVNAPAGSRAAGADEQAHVVSREVTEVGPRTILAWDRVQLPRTVAWGVEVDVPPGAIAHTALPAQAPTLRSVVYTERPDPVPLLLGLGLLGLCLLRRVLTLLRCRRQALASAPLLPVGGRVVRGILLFATAAAGGIWVGTTPLLGIAFWLLTVLLSLDRRLHRHKPELVQSRPVSARELGAARRRGWLQHIEARAWLDGTTVLGASALLGLWTLVLYMDAQLGSASLPTYILLMATPLWFNGIRLTGPPAVEDALVTLESLRERIAAAPAPGLHPAQPATLMLSVDERDRPIGAHLELSPVAPSAGLHALQLTASEVRWIDSTRSELAWRVLADEQTPAAGQAAQALRATPRRRSSGVMSWLAVTHDPLSELPSLLAWLTRREAQRTAA